MVATNGWKGAVIVEEQWQRKAVYQNHATSKNAHSHGEMQALT